MTEDVVSSESVVGYVPKTETVSLDYHSMKQGEYLVFPTIWRTRGIKKLWGEEDWPPIKVRVTIEVLK